ncbi:UDP-glycosyltransferase TURAN-like [Ananas comosus]|uniref:UDP-glycosyltransferase TURAN-like n=1 Tax=Ananas comosus TaxID=4615 RepID=A0A6P5GZI7_ANACO|nr:UDP-glycosyltransferase TURAN-like [Ananas comosus]
MENPSIYIHKMRQAPYQDSRRIPLVLRLLVKAIFQFFVLIWFIWFKIQIPDVFIVQHPPSLPALLVIKLTSWFRLTSLIIDWHDYMHTPFGLSSNRFPTAVRIYHWFERFLGRMADGALCVTQAIQHDLSQKYGIEAKVFYDQTYDSFQPATIKEKHELFCRLREDFSYLYDIESWVNNRDAGTVRRITSAAENCKEYDATDTLLTAQIDDGFRDKSDRPAVIATCMNWNREKNISMLLEAAAIYDKHLDSTLNVERAEQISLGADTSTDKKHLYPKILFIIIAKEGEQQKYENIFGKSLLKHVAFFTLSLASVDYQILLGSADLGVCLNTSSSGLDLPFTVADMFGCGLPVCGASFPGIEELIDDWRDGLVFSTSSDLANSFLTLFRGFPYNCNALKLMRMGALAKASSVRWHAEWENQVKPFIEKVGFFNLSDFYPLLCLYVPS